MTAQSAAVAQPNPEIPNPGTDFEGWCRYLWKKDVKPYPDGSRERNYGLPPDSFKLGVALSLLEKERAKPLHYAAQEDDYSSVNVQNGKDIVSIRDKKGELKASLEFGEHELKLLLISLLEWFTDGEVLNGEPMEFTLSW